MNVPHTAPGTVRIEILNGSGATAQAVHACLAGRHRLVSDLEQLTGQPEGTRWQFFADLTSPAVNGGPPPLTSGPPKNISVRARCSTKAHVQTVAQDLEEAFWCVVPEIQRDDEADAWFCDVVVDPSHRPPGAA